MTCTAHNESAGHLLYPVCANIQTSQATSLYNTVCTRIRSKANTLHNHGWSQLVNLQLLHFLSITQAAIMEIRVYMKPESAFALQSPTDIQLTLSFSHINNTVYRSERNFILELFSIIQSWYSIKQT